MTRSTAAAALRKAGAGALAAWLGTVAALGGGGQSATEEAFFDGTDHPAVAYTSTLTTDPVAALSARLDAGAARLDFDPASGYLRSLLRALDVRESSQVALFSKTSLQAQMISPANPRAIFFNDQTVVAWPGGGFIEIATQDATQGTHFYVLPQEAAGGPRFIRSPKCLGCHVSYATLNVPGFIVRSVAAGPSGQIVPQVWSSTTSHRTPLTERWAGWYVTGRSGGAAHLGNQLTPIDTTDTEPRPAPSTVPWLPDRLAPGRYPSPHSDIVALLVFDHQMHGMNLLTRLGWETRVALADRPADAEAVAARAAIDVVDYLLFVDEAPLAGPVGGDSGFAAQFAARGPTDGRGRSLRELDLTTRLLRHPCSYLIYSPAFDALPAVAKQAVYARLWRVLSGEETAARYARRTLEQRTAIVDILRDTKPDLPAIFQAPTR